MEKKNQKTSVYNVIIMDRSGSMWDIQKPAIQGFNEVLGGVKAAAAKFSDTLEQKISLVLFDSTSIDNLHWNADPSSVEILTDKTYVPGACTPLYDAMGRTLTRLERELKGKEAYSVAVTVITDGYENDSCEYDLPAVRKLIEHLKEQGWSFAYMGTDHDVEGVTVSLSITNVIRFEKTEEKTLETFLKERRARERWAEQENEFCLSCESVSPDERIVFNRKRSANYYEEQQEECKKTLPLPNETE
ncbi:MAG: VWA domain-containing protein [Bacteroidales bacterium]|nr:VWA domain-containing protein [Bacteroidales bacterium]